MKDQNYIQEIYPGDGPKATIVVILIGAILMMIGAIVIAIGTGVAVNCLINLITK